MPTPKAEPEEISMDRPRPDPRRRATTAMLVSLLLAAILGCGGELESETDAPATETAAAGDWAARPPDLWRLRNLGRAYFDENDTEQAIAVLGACAQRTDAYADHLNLGIALVRGHHFEEGRQELGRALELEPDAVSPHYVLGIAATREGRWDEAREAFQTVVDAGEADAPTWYHLGVALRNLEQVDAAQRALRAAVRADPLHVSARYQLFLAFREQGAMDKARAELERVKELRGVVPDFKRTDEALAASIHTELLIEPPDRLQAASAEPLIFEDVSDWFGAAAPAFADVLLVDASGDGALDVIGMRPGGGVLLVSAGAGALRRAAAPALEAVHVLGSTTGEAHRRRATAGDFDHDGLPDVCAIGADGLELLRGDGASGFESLTASSGLDLVDDVATNPLAVDHDHDGDLDLVVWGAAAPGARPATVVCVNEGKPTAESVLRFHVDTEVLPAGGPEEPAQLDFVDFEDNEAVDILELHAEAPSRFLENQRRLKFRERGEARGFQGVRGQAMALGDIDGDLDDDLLVVGDGAAALRLSQRDGTLREATAWLPELPQPLGAADVALADLDNDGDLDAVVSGSGAGDGVPVRLWTNTGTRFAPSEGTPSLPRARFHRVEAGDLDRDGLVDLVLLRADGPPVVWRNTGSAAGRRVEVVLRGGRSAGDGRGTTIELRASASSVRRVARAPATSIGLAGDQPIDVVRLVWPNGAIQSIIDPAFPDGEPLVIDEKKEVAGSCPVLYVWNGAGYEMATDLMGTAPLGFPLGPGSFLEPHPHELVRIPAGVRLARQAGDYRLVLAEEMREIVYLDRMRLVVVEHPDTIAVFSNYLLSPPPFAPPRLLALSRVRAPRSALDHDGNDVQALVSAVDRRYPQNFALLDDPFQGLATHQCLVLDFGDLTGYRRPVLVMTGWTDWTDGPAETAIEQHRDLATQLPVLEVPDGAGGWRPVSPWFGFPSLKTKDILIELDGKLNPGDSRLRVCSNLRVYWDRIVIGDELEPAAAGAIVRDHRLAPRAAELFAKGTSVQSSPDGRLPLVYDYERRRPAVWRSQRGLATRYGDVRELLDETDDRTVVFTIGDAVEVMFDASAVPAPPARWTRTFFVESHGWEKEGDYYTAVATTVEPLPFGNMSGYPPPPSETLPDAVVHDLFEYHTRPIGR